MKITFDRAQDLLRAKLSGFWGLQRYWIFQDPEYELLPPGIATELLARAPTVTYVTDVYDCDDHALEFKAYVARTQAATYKQYTRPLCVGYARGRFSWAAGGTTEHVANFSIWEDGEIYWTDLQLRKWKPLAELRKGLSWLIL